MLIPSHLAGKRREYRQHLIVNSSDRLQRFRFTGKGLRQFVTDSRQTGCPLGIHRCEYAFCPSTVSAIFATEVTGNVREEALEESFVVSVLSMADQFLSGFPTAGLYVYSCRFPLIRFHKPREIGKPSLRFFLSKLVW